MLYQGFETEKKQELLTGRFVIYYFVQKGYLAKFLLTERGINLTNTLLFKILG